MISETTRRLIVTVATALIITTATQADVGQGPGGNNRRPWRRRAIPNEPGIDLGRVSPFHGLSRWAQISPDPQGFTPSQLAEMAAAMAEVCRIPAPITDELRNRRTRRRRMGAILRSRIARADGGDDSLVTGSHRPRWPKRPPLGDFDPSVANIANPSLSWPDASTTDFLPDAYPAVPAPGAALLGAIGLAVVAMGRRKAKT